MREKVNKDMAVLCNCMGERDSEMLAQLNYVPLIDNKHTSLRILKCKKCDGIRGFPHENLEIAMRDGTRQTKEFLRHEFKLEV